MAGIVVKGLIRLSTHKSRQQRICSSRDWNRYAVRHPPTSVA